VIRLIVDDFFLNRSKGRTHSLNAAIQTYHPA
jgi:hypothetical protein